MCDRLSGRERTAATERASTVAGLLVTEAAIVSGLGWLTWIVTVDRMQGMDAGPDADLGGLGWFVGVWATMMAAMMRLLLVIPTTLVFARSPRNVEQLARS